MLIQVQEAVNSIKESHQHLKDGRLEKAFLQSNKAVQCSGMCSYVFLYSLDKVKYIITLILIEHIL